MDSFYPDPELDPEVRRKLQPLLKEALSDPKCAEKLKQAGPLLKQLGGDPNDVIDTVAERVQNWQAGTGGAVEITAETVGGIISQVLDSLLSDRQRTVAAAEKQRAVAQAKAQQAAAAPPARRPAAKPTQPTAMSGQRGIEEVVRQNAPAIAKALSGPARAVTLQLDEKAGQARSPLSLSGGLATLKELRT